VVREALRILEISGLITIKKGPGGGVFVSHIYDQPIINSLNNMIAAGEATLDHLFDVRLLVEPHIAKEAALHAKKSDLKQIKDLVADSEDHLGDPKHLKKNNLKFHLYLAQASGNPVMAIVLEAVFKILIELSLDFLDLSLEKQFFSLHKEIYACIADRRPDEAEELIRKDILDVKSELVDHLSDSRHLKTGPAHLRGLVIRP
jgi:GntR family transcriptional repressor for pyruvate dehydrogenase complex